MLGSSSLANLPILQELELQLNIFLLLFYIVYSINKELLAKEKMLTVDTANLSRKAEASITEDILFCIENLYLP